MKTFLKLILIVVFIAGVVGIGYYFLLLPRLNPDNPVKKLSDQGFGWKFPVAKFPQTGDPNQLAYSDIRDPGGIPQGLPIRLKIPVIGVDSAIEDAYITSDGRMDVPASTINVAWFALGPHPGNEGSAVIGGHYGFYEANKGPTVFYNLDKLKVGDKVYIENDNGDTLAFIVRRIQLFDRNADATTVFTSGDGLAHLNLITCEGLWNQVNDSYPDRRVVFTDAIPTEGSVEVKAKPIATAKPKLPEAAITTPIPSTSAEPTPTPTLIAKNPLPSHQILIASAKSLYENPLDGLITSFLLISIVFMAIRIIRR